MPPRKLSEVQQVPQNRMILTPIRTGAQCGKRTIDIASHTVGSPALLMAERFDYFRALHRNAHDGFAIEWHLHHQVHRANLAVLRWSEVARYPEWRVRTKRGFPS